MGERISIYCIKEPSEARFQHAFEEALATHGGRIEWNKEFKGSGYDCRTAHSEFVTSVSMSYAEGRLVDVFEDLGVLLAEPSLWLRIQEGSLWEYTLQTGRTVLDKFSVAPQYWTDDPAAIAQCRGNAELFARVWGIPRERIERYIVDWEMHHINKDIFRFKRTGMAYDTDEFPYGSIWQMFDFLGAIGGKDPTNLLAGAVEHVVQFPDVQILLPPQ